MRHHFTLLITEGRLHLAPIGPDPETILDIGTGTGEPKSKPYCAVTLNSPIPGIWAIDMGMTSYVSSHLV